jgi:hypothetical protein
MADYSKKALYSRKEMKLIEVTLDEAFVKDVVFDAAGAGGGVKDTGTNLPAGEVLTAQVKLKTPVTNGSIAVVKLQLGAAGAVLLSSTGLAVNGANDSAVNSEMKTIAVSDLYLHITADAGNAADWEDTELEVKILMLVANS